MTPKQQVILTSRFHSAVEWSCDGLGVFHFKSGTKENIAAAQAIVDSFDPVAEEAAEKARIESEAKAAPYRELAILKLAAAEAEAAGDTKAQEAIAKSVADLQA